MKEPESISLPSYSHTHTPTHTHTHGRSPRNRCNSARSVTEIWSLSYHFPNLLLKLLVVGLSLQSDTLLSDLLNFLLFTFL